MAERDYNTAIFVFTNIVSRGDGKTLGKTILSKMWPKINVKESQLQS